MDFDELAKSLSRGDVLTALGAAILGMLVPKSAEARKRKRRRRRRPLSAERLTPPLPPPPSTPPFCFESSSGCCSPSPMAPCSPTRATCRCQEGEMCFGCCVDAPPRCGTTRDCAMFCGFCGEGLCRMSIDGALWCASTLGEPVRCEANEDCPSRICLKENSSCPGPMVGNVCASQATPL